MTPGADQPEVAPDFNRQTLAGYEGCAIGYAQSTAPQSADDVSDALTKLLRIIKPGGELLEIGGGPGWDADWLESKGLSVWRTDATEAFVNFQTARGKTATRLDVLMDPLDGPYDGVIALYVFQHVERRELPLVFQKIASAIRSGGHFLFSIRDGRGEEVEHGSDGAVYHSTLWQQAELLAELTPLGLDLLWSKSTSDSEGAWLVNLLQKR